jgi:hypothetical protein
METPHNVRHKMGGEGVDIQQAQLVCFQFIQFEWCGINGSCNEQRKKEQIKACVPHFPKLRKPAAIILFADKKKPPECVRR